MLEMAANPAISGLTTNPSLMKKAGVKDYAAYAKDILSIIKDKPISFEVFADDLPTMERQAAEIKTWGRNVYVKIPVINTKGEKTQALVKKLTQSGVQLNVTAVTTLDQVQDVCHALEKGAPSLLSVFAGRIADTGVDPIPMVKASAEIVRNMHSPIELLWASTREIYNIFQAEAAGCQIITVPPDILKKLSGLGKDLYQLSVETVKTFKADSDVAGFTI